MTTTQYRSVRHNTPFYPSILISIGASHEGVFTEPLRGGCERVGKLSNPQVDAIDCLPFSRADESFKGSSQKSWGVQGAGCVWDHFSTTPGYPNPQDT